VTEEKFAESVKSGENPADTGGKVDSAGQNNLQNPQKTNAERGKKPKKSRSNRSSTVMGRLFRANSKDGDRFRWVFVLSVVAHLVVVLGISFVLPSEEEDAGAPLLPTSGSPPKQTQTERERKLVEEQANAIFNTDQPENQSQPNSPIVRREDLRNAIDIAYLISGELATSG